MTRATLQVDLVHSCIALLKSKTKDDQVKRDVVNRLEAAGTFDAIREILSSLEAQIRVQIQELGGNAMLEKIVDILAQDYTKQTNSHDRLVKQHWTQEQILTNQWRTTMFLQERK